eukprot:TRINITY_DN6375_c0_g1_i1.p1 TRINITY_DN6375_c0_g1~~TRINITY_DN6375_c0_g1_i1.p1  ORF type:complete len:376 (-),score=64.36 TRINITY_DN6375_c0_g1_i1:233-1360(-)
MQPKYQAFGEENESFQHSCKNPFGRKIEKRLKADGAKEKSSLDHTGKPKITAIESLGGDVDEGYNETPRVDHGDGFSSESQTHFDLKHSRTAEVSKTTYDLAPLERSRTIPAEKVKSDVRLAEITEDELDTFTNVLKDKLILPRFYKKQFDLISSLPPTPSKELEALALNLLPPKRPKLTNKTIVFDLDETLISVMTDEALAGTRVVYKKDMRRISYIASNTGKPTEVNAIVRPYAIKMLKQLNSYYEIIVFTAANKAYADAVIKLIDPDNVLIDHILYRDSCIKLNNYFIKDLRILNRDLSAVIMVENSIVSFSRQIENGVVVSEFTGTRTDAELAELWVFLRQAASAEDVRVAIASKYSLKLFYQIYNKIKVH